jgi:hypothetical protein
MKKLTATGEELLLAQRTLARSRRYAEKAELLAGRALMMAKRSRELSDEASEFIKPTLLRELRKLSRKAIDELT